MSSPATDPESTIFDDILMRGGADARKELALRLCEFLSQNPQIGPRREVAVESLLKLAIDPVSEVRHAVAQRLCGLVPLETDLIFTIVADEDEIALPFLAASPALDVPVMQAILRVGDEQRQISLAGRQDLPSVCADFIIAEAEWPVCAALLDNRAIALSEGDYRRLYRRFAGVPQIVERLLARDDVPLDIRILQAKQASGRLQDYLDSSALVKNDPTDLMAHAEETATLRVLAQAYDSELDATIPFLLNRQMLTSSLILRAAVVGEMRVVERAVALLSGVALERTHAFLYQRGSLSSRSVISRCGLPQAVKHVILAAVEVERSVRQERRDVSSDDFGCRLVERIMTRFEKLGVDEKIKLLQLVEEFATERPSAMAAKLKLSLGRSGVIAA